MANGLRLLPQGANTGLVGASVPPTETPTVVLSIERLRSSVAIDVGSATATVTAGTRLSELNEAAAAYGLQLPIDLGADPAIGGMIATNTGGSRVLRYGPMRRHVLGVGGGRRRRRHIGLRVPRRVAQGQPRPRRDAARRRVGWHARRDHRSGRRPRCRSPTRRPTWWLAVDDASRVLELFGVLDRRRPGALTAFELVSRAALERTVVAAGAPPNPFGHEVPNVAVLAEWSFAGDGGGDGVEDDIDAAFDAGLLTDGRLVEPSLAWALRHRVSESLRTLGVVLGHDVSVPRSSLMDVRQRAIDAVAALAPEAVMCDFGHVGDGGLHLNVLFPSDVGPPGDALRAAIRGAIDDIVAGRRWQLQRRARTRPAQRRALAGDDTAHRATPGRRAQGRRRPAPPPRPPRPPLQPPLTASDWSVCCIGVFCAGRVGT